MSSHRTANLKRMQWTSVSLLVLMGIINYFDRSTLAIASGTISQDLGLSATELGLVFSAFSWAYAFAQLPTGAILDSKGARRTLGIGLAAWSVAQALSGFTHSMWQLFAARTALGIGEAPQYTGGVKAISDWFVVRDRGLPTGVFLASTTIGSMLAPPILTALMVTWGWRIMFVVMGLIGLALAAVWFAVYRDRASAPLTEEERRYYAADAAGAAGHGVITRAQWKGLFRHPTTWGIALGFVGVMYMVTLTLAWLPGFISKQYHFSTVTTGWVLVIPYLFATVGMFVSGYLADYLVALKWTPIASRKLPLCVGLLGCAVFSVLVVSTGNTVLSIAFLCAAMFFTNLAGGSAWGLVSVAAPRHMVASVGSIQNFIGFFGGAFAPLVTGWVIDRTGSFSAAFVIAAAIASLSAFAYAALVKRPIVAGEERALLPDAAQHI